MPPSEAIAERTREPPWHLAWIAALVVLIAAAWEGFSQAGLLPRHALPPLSDVVAAAGHLLSSGRFRSDLGSTFLTVALAFCLAAPPAVLAGLLIGQYAHRTRRLSTAFNIVLGVPQSIFLPVFVLAFGVSFQEKLAFGMTHAFFVVTVTAVAAVAAVPERLVTAARVYGASDAQVFRHVYLPAMAPLIAGGLRIGLIFTLIGVLVAEMYASRAGVGRLVLLWSEMYQLANVVAAVLMISTIAIAGNEALRLLERRAWQRESAQLRM